MTFLHTYVKLHYHMRAFITIFFLLIIPPTLAAAKTAPISEYTLANGLKVIVKEDHRAPIVIGQIWYKVGSSYESHGTTGISHALEHMMFRGTKKYGPGMLDKIVVENGGLHNAFTGNDETCYFEILPADKLDLIFDLESDRMQGLLLDEASFLKEKQVILEERKMLAEDIPNKQTEERFFATAFASNPYSIPVIGWMHDIQNLNVTDLKNWYEKWYMPNNATLVVVGDVKPKHVFKLAKKYFGKIKSRKLTANKTDKEIDPVGKRTIEVKIPAKLPYLMMGYNVPSLKTADQKWQAYALEVINAILSGNESARLPKDLIRKQQIATFATTRYNIDVFYDRLDTLFIFMGTPAPNHTTKELEQAFLNQIKKLQTDSISKEELNRAKITLIANKTYAKDSIVEQAKKLGELETIGLPWSLSEEYVKNIQAVTPEQIKTIAKKYFVTERSTVAELQPLKEKYHSTKTTK